MFKGDLYNDYTTVLHLENTNCFYFLARCSAEPLNTYRKVYDRDNISPRQHAYGLFLMKDTLISIILCLT